MTHLFEQNTYSNYFWKEGKPFGIGPLSSDKAEKASSAYKIISDPYHKHITVEEYIHGSFSTLIYDSQLLDFRYLEPREQRGWYKTCLTESFDKTVSIIRNLDDRVILLETCFFENHLCRLCLTTSAHGILLSRQMITYAHLGDLFSGVTLYDSHFRKVMLKKYQSDSSGFFSELLEEKWNFSNK